ncbi:NAD(P)/FAD-dependent oxidoreductase [Halomonas organivorans]|uniref:Selenide,water dikinase n=1 Tax=Halomonas organivorans TaxID=257772 RepID=A0A7W5BXD7_9GAMM|nr:FAD-dependent oxidoreductase [Halomonas organivorans]MBB3140851.1 selenide,water dikinase [Halomonas organivorans]
MIVDPPPSGAPLLLVGAGHAHLHLIRQRRQLPAQRVILLDPGGFWYSGMASGMLGGQFMPQADRLDPMQLARRHGVEGIRGRLSGLDLDRREALLADGRRLAIAATSLNLGSTLHLPAAHPEGPALWPVKPIPRLLALRRHLSRAFDSHQRLHLVVVGGGASGIEVACQLRALAERHAATPEIRLLTRAPALLPGAPRGAVNWLRRRLARRRITVMTGLECCGPTRGGVMVASPNQPWGEDSYRFLAADHVVHATGLSPPDIVERLGLPTLPDRGLAITATLQSPAASWVFAAGDCAAMIDHELPRLGVYGVRQAPVLLANIAAYLQGSELHPYHPQPRALSILDLGDGQALAIRGRYWWGGRLAWWWKRQLDERFLSAYR